MTREPEMTDNARRIFDARYPRKDEAGEPAETPGEAMGRVADNVASVNALYVEHPKRAEVEREHYDNLAPADFNFPERTAVRQYRWLARHGHSLASFEEQMTYGRDAAKRQAEVYRAMLANLDFVPNSPTWTGAGTPLGQLAACFVLPISDDLVGARDSIFETLRVAAAIQQTGGGNGFDFSGLRPSGALVRTSMGQASGPVGFMAMYDAAFGSVAQGGSRRGANMGVMRVDHPDVLSFIKAKTVEGKVANFNISVAVTDEFMKAVDADDDFDLTFKGEVYDTIDARDLWDELVTNAHIIGDPGCLFIDRANEQNPVPQRYDLRATNPCVTGDTLVLTPSGWRRVDSIAEGEAISTVFGSGEVHEVEVHESRPVYKVVFSDGGVVRATAAHQFHVRDSQAKFFEERTLDKVEVGDWVRVSMTRAVPDNPVEQPDDSGLDDRTFGFLIGTLVGDGCYTEKTLARKACHISTHVDEEGWNDQVVDAFLSLDEVDEHSLYPENNGTKTARVYMRPNPRLAEWVMASRLTPAKSHEKVLPDEYINSNERFLKGLVDGLFSTDGSVDLSSNHPLVRFHTSSEELALQVRRIMLMFGIHGRVCESQRTRHDIDGRVLRHDRPKYDVVISGTSFGKFVEEFTLSHPDKQARLREATKWCNHTGGNYAAKVVSIEPDGVETVYDLYEPESDTWVTEGYVSRGCGEQWLGPYENCCLGHINLSNFVTEGTEAVPGRHFDWDVLEDVVYYSVQFLDDVVDANQYVDPVPELEVAAQSGRRIGLGLMGLHDAMLKLGLRYDSEEGRAFASQVNEFVLYHAMLASIERAEQRGPFPWHEGSVYDSSDLAKYGPGAQMDDPVTDKSYRLWAPPEPLEAAYNNSYGFGRPMLDWDEVTRGLIEHGIRNSTLMTWAPTGTTSNVAGLEGSGCEPLFALAYKRRVMQESEDIVLDYLSPLFAQALEDAGLDEEQREGVLADVKANGGSCQTIEYLPESVRDTFVVAADIAPADHVKMQAALQAFTDNSISKTINMPNEATVEDVAEVYRLAFDLGCKGITVYRQGSRSLEVLSTSRDEEQQETTEDHWPLITPMQMPPEAEDAGLDAVVRKVRTPHGSMWATITEIAGHPGRPFDVRLTVGKAGNDKLADIEAIGRSVSLALRSGVDVKHVIEQLEGIGGRSFAGFGENRVHSAADGLAQALRDRYLNGNRVTITNGEVDSTRVCPDCKNTSLVFEDGCLHCEPRLGGCGEYSGCD